MANILSCKLFKVSGRCFERPKLSSLSMSFVAGEELLVASFKLRGASPGVEGKELSAGLVTETTGIGSAWLVMLSPGPRSAMVSEDKQLSSAGRGHT